MDDVMIIWVLLGWVALSVPVSLVMGELFRSAAYDPFPRWSEEDERQLARLLDHSTRLPI